MTAGRLRAPDRRIVEHLDAARLGKDVALGRVREHLQLDMAHTVMITEEGIITAAQGKAILEALRDGYRMGDEFPIDPSYDTMVLQIERFLIGRVGEDTGGRMHTGRSRIDMSAAIERIAGRNCLLRVHDQFVELCQSVLGLAERHASTLMPGWTHLQHAQPWTLGHYLLRHLYVWDRHLTRLEAAYGRTNVSSLGGAALAGTSWPLNRRRVAELLGHDDIVRNSADAGEVTLDWIAEDLAVLSMLLVDIGRMASDLYLWHTWEFGLVELDDAFCGSSSIMPQKKNAKSMEYVRGCAGKAVGWLPSALGVARSASSVDVDPVMVGNTHTLDEAADITWRCLDMIAGVLMSLQVNEERMADVAGAHWSTASALADGIVRERDLPFRAAHRIVARLVRNCVEAGVAPVETTTEILDAAARDVGSPELGLPTGWIREQLDARKFIESRVTEGSPSPGEVARQVEELRNGLAEHQEWNSRRHDQLEAARLELERSIDRLTA
ncbi:argininosuccinate lyase [Micromonospora sp. NPDC048830]|uniref:argininosuccinate lyase n=1 Tax=Micromonospora sp. NPDC048830 TaxID=3364257 RepID=UPI0037139400